MAYNLQSLITILEQILNPEETRWILDHKKPLLQSLLQKATSLQQIFEKSSLPNIESLETQIQDVIQKAEDIIETHMVDQLLSMREGVSFTFSPPHLQQVMQQLDSAMEQLAKLVQGKKMSTASSSSGASVSHVVGSKSVVVGIDKDLMWLKDRLTGMPSKVEIIPIVGMGGIGKTTIARKLYQDPFIVSHFDLRAWSTISQDYSMLAILSSLLGCKRDEINEQSGLDKLYKTLYCRRYLIVLDDIWSTEAWDGIRRYFPDNNNGSRIVITTRESDVARYADSLSAQHRVQLLSESESWNLLRQIVFGEEDCSNVLQGIGEKISSGCGGLPLAISVIGGLLSKLERSEDVWEKIGKDVRGAIADSDQQFSNILSLSYDHLPNHLKPCFLYMGAFPEDYEIKTSRLVRLWVAEGFVKLSSNANNNKSLEEEAEDYLKALVERNLVLVRGKKFNGKAKTNNMHDLLRDLCMRKADEEKFLRVKNSPEVTFSNLRRVSVHTHHASENALYMYDSPELIPFARSFLSTGLIWHQRESPSPMFFALRLLRVLDVMQMIFPIFPLEIFQLVNLRYLAFFSESSMPSEISKLCNLQTLIATLGFGNVPCEIWEMPELRHLKLNRMIHIDDEYMQRIVQKKLQTVSSVRLTNSLISNGFLERIPNIKTLDIFYADDSPPGGAVDLSHLHELETLRWSYGNHLRPLRFPSNLRKLTLSSCVIFTVLLKSLCALPNLEVLKIKSCVFGKEEERDEEEWEAREGDEFSSLQFLHLFRLNLVRWIADEKNFPRLRHLLIRECLKIEEIPSTIGEIPTLELIELDQCSDSALDSARQIVEEQQSEFDNYSIQLLVNGMYCSIFLPSLSAKKNAALGKEESIMEAK